MLTSESRILTTHAGSLPRPAALAELHGRRSRGEDVDPDELRQAVEEATAAVDRRPGRRRHRHRQRRRAGAGELRHLRAAPHDRLRRHEPAAAHARPARAPRLPRAGRSPASQRIKVSLMAAPAAIADVTYRDTTELDAECALVADAPFAQTFMTAASPGIVASAMENRHYAVAGGVRARRRRRAAHRVPRHRRPRPAAADRRARPRPGAPHAVRRPPARRVPRRGSSWWSTPSTARSTGIDPAAVRLHVCWGNYEGPHTHDVAARRDPAAALRGARRRARDLDGQRPPRPRGTAASSAGRCPTAWCSSPG